MLVNTLWRAKLKNSVTVLRAASFVCVAVALVHSPLQAQNARAAPPLAATATAGMPELKALGGGLL